MWSIGGAALAVVLLSAGAVMPAMRKVRREAEPTLQSFDTLRRDVSVAIDRAARDGGRARAGRQVLVRHGRSSTPR